MASDRDQVQCIEKVVTPVNRSRGSVVRCSDRAHDPIVYSGMVSTLSLMRKDNDEVTDDVTAVVLFGIPRCHRDANVDSLWKIISLSVTGTEECVPRVTGKTSTTASSLQAFLPAQYVFSNVKDGRGAYSVGSCTRRPNFKSLAIFLLISLYVSQPNTDTESLVSWNFPFFFFLFAGWVDGG